MAGWWRGGRERPWTSDATWRWYPQGTTWTGADWHDPSWQDENSRQWEGLTNDWRGSQWEESWDNECQTSTPPSPELAVHEPEQYPWTRAQSQDAQQGSPGCEDSTRRAPVTAEVSDITPGASCSGDPSQELRMEEDELEKLHSIAIRRFRLALPSPDSDAEADITADEYQVDPDVGIYDPDTKGVYCKLCDMELNSKKQFVDHLKGKKHWKKQDKKEKGAKEAKEAAEVACAALSTPLQ